jgi:hypothetical protein
MARCRLRDRSAHRLAPSARHAVRDFDDYWTPFLSGVGPAPGYCAALPADQRAVLRARLLTGLSPSGTGPIVMNARAFAARGTVPPAT